VSRTVFRSMGCDVVVEGASPRRATAIRELFERYDATFSRFRPDSELNRLNLAGGGVVSGLFADALDVARWAVRVSDGLVDLTVGAAVVAAGYDRDFAAGLDSDQPVRTMSTGVRGITHRCVIGRLLQIPCGTVLDLNGVVKSLAVDRAAALLDADGFVSAGGDLATRGAVDVALTGGVVRARGGLATSGTTRRRWQRAGEAQHHLIDPRTGAPSRSRWLEVTVCAADCVTADVAAKAAFLLDEDGPEWLDARGLPGRFVGEEIVENGAWRAALEVACT
jgi:FAD:protein FMN transferase